MDIEKARNRLEQTGPILRGMMNENLNNSRLVDQLHQLINHLLAVKGHLGD